MDLKVEITTKETIKPISPTPNHLKILKLSILDQLAINLHVPIILFYTPTQEVPTKNQSHLLKKSFQEALTLLYPLAGRRSKDNAYIDCNDEGAIYVETQVESNMSGVLKNPNINYLRQLLPCCPNQNLINFSISEILLVQINRFRCGGIAIGVCISHVIADASTVGTFVNSWAAKARGDENSVGGVIFDCTSVFRPIESIGLSLDDFIDKDSLLKNTMINRFVFEGSKIGALREKIGFLEPSLDFPTRFEAVSALIWGTLIALTKEKEETSIKTHLAITAVDLRKRMNPRFPQDCIGNIWQITTASFSLENNESTTDYKLLAGKIHESVRKMSDENVRRFHENGGMLKFVRSESGKMGKRRAYSGVISFSSWCKFPFYEADFGWGKPIWVATALGHNRVAIFLDTRDGEGIEVWLGLPEEHMVLFEQNPNIIEYASFNSSKFDA